jgi:Tol biopolymer transport system component
MLSAKLRNWVILLGWVVLVSALVSCGGGGTSTTPPQSVQPPVIPSVTSTVPGAVNAGQPFLNLEVDGSNFLPGATVLWNGSARPTTLENSATLSVSLAAGDIASAGTAQISVLNPPPKGGTSNVFIFTITAPVNATPSLSSVTPSPIFAGSSFTTITATGSNIAGSSAVQWNGNNQATTFLSTTQLQASILDLTILSPGIANVDVFNFPPGGGASNVVSVPVVAGGTPAGVIDLASATGGGTQGDRASRHAVISPNGRYIAFESLATNLIPSGANGNSQIFVRDTCFGAPLGCQPGMAMVSVASDGSQGNADSYMPTISADGRFVAFESLATNLVPTVVGAGNIFVHDRDSHLSGVFDQPGGITNTLVSVASDGTPGGGTNPVISAAGRFVAFASGADNLVPNDTNGAVDVFLRDTCSPAPSGCTPSTVRVSVATDGTQAEGSAPQSYDPSISADGRFVAFASTATNLVPGKTNSATDIYLRDTCFAMPASCTPSTTRVSLKSDGSQAQVGGQFASMSADARFVAFISANLTPNAPIGIPAVFIRDTCHGVATGCSAITTLASEGNGGTNANGASFTPAISPDGRFVAFQSAATNLAVNNPNDTNQQPDFFVYDTCLGVASGCTPVTFQVSVANDGTQSRGEQGVESPNIQISSGGRVVVFASDALNLLPNNTNGVREIFRVVSGFQ